MAAPSVIPSARTLHTLAMVVAGHSPNGTDPRTVEIGWRSVLLRLAETDPAGRGPVLAAGLEGMVLTADELESIYTAIGTVDTAQPKPQEARPLLEFLRGGQIFDLPPISWLMEGMIPDASNLTIYGPSGAGKSFLTLSMALHVALGWEWYGRKVRKGIVIYVVAEGQNGIGQRYRAWCNHYHHGLPVNDFIVVPMPVFPTQAEYVAALYSYIDRLEGPVAMILFDTLFRCYTGDENSTADMGAFVRAIDGIRTRTGAVQGMIHHTGWDKGRMRGNSSLLGAMETVMRVEQDDLGTVTLAFEKTKDAGTPPPWRFDLLEVEGTGSVVATLSHDQRSARAPSKAMPETHLAALKIVVDGGLGGATFAAVKLGMGVARNATVNAVLSDLCHGGYATAEGEPKTPNRRYVATTKGGGAAADQPAADQSDPGDEGF